MAETPPSNLFLHVHLIQAKDLPRQNSAISSLWRGKCNPYCTVRFDSKTFKSKTISSSVKPEWDEKSTFQLNNDLDGTLYVHIWSCNKTETFDDLVGFCEISVAEIHEAQEKHLEDIFKLNNEANEGEIQLGFIINDKEKDADVEEDDDETHVIDGNHMLVEYRHENQRQIDEKWTTTNTVKGDPHSWSSDYNEQYIEKRLWMRIPSRWQWCTDWEIDRTEEDAEGMGWKYGLRWDEVKFENQSNAQIRTRRWKRARRFISQEHKVSDPDPDMRIPDLTNFGTLGVRDAIDVLGTFRNKFFVLEGQTLYWFTDDPAKNPYAKCEDLLMCSQIAEMDKLTDPSNNHHISISTGESQYIIKCVNEDNQNQWYSDLQAVRKKWSKNLPADKETESEEKTNAIVDAAISSAVTDKEKDEDKVSGGATDETPKKKKKKKNKLQSLPFKEGLKRKGYKLDVQHPTNELWLAAEISDVLIPKGNDIHRFKIHFIGFHKAYDKWLPSSWEKIAEYKTESSEKTRQQAIEQKMLPEKGARQTTGKEKRASSVDEYQQCRCIIS